MQPISVPLSDDPRRIPEKGPILVAHQPEFLPYLGNIAKATMGDVYLILDTVQFVKEHWQSRNRIRISGQGGWQWLIIPLKDVAKHMMPSNEVVIAGDHWKKKHLNAIRLSYGKAPFFRDFFPGIEEIYNREHVMLVDFLMDIIRFAFQSFRIGVPVYKTSELISMGYTITGIKSELIITMCRSVGANTFVFGRDGKTYIEKETFFRENIDFVFQDFHHPEYPQIHGGEFIPYMSFIDLLFNCGQEESIRILGGSPYTRE